MNDVHASIARIALNLDNSMYVITATAGGERAGCLVGFATQCSVHPPRWLVCISKTNKTWEVATRSRVLGVHILGVDDAELAELFGGQTTDEVDKFARCEWREGPDDVPILTQCESWFVARVLQRLEVGDHDAFLLDPIEASSAAHKPLGFQSVKHIEPGHPP